MKIYSGGKALNIMGPGGGCSGGEIYSAEEVCIGKWMDSDHYRVVLIGTLIQLNGQVVGTLRGVGEITFLSGALTYTSGDSVPLDFAQGMNYTTISTGKSGDDLIVYLTSNVSSQLGGQFRIVVEYTKAQEEIL